MVAITLLLNQPFEPAEEPGEQLLRFTIILITVCAAAITAALWIGATRPISPAANVKAMFSMPDGTPCDAPCLFGIEPGKTKYDDAVMLIRTHPFVRNVLRLSDKDIVTTTGFTAWAHNQNEVGFLYDPWEGDAIEEVFYQSKDQGFSLGQLLLSLGTPQNIEFGVNIGLHNEITELAGAISFSDTITLLEFSHPIDERFQLTDHPDALGIRTVNNIAPCGPSFCHKWQGFMSMRNYAKDYPISP